MADPAAPARAQVEQDEDQQDIETQQRICDFCGQSVALLYCRADSAKLCLSCDREVHSTNQLFTKHTRWQLCDACDSTPASILCSTENTVLCHNCDWERHRQSLSFLHERRPLEGFSGVPSVSELLTAVGFEDLSKKDLLGEDDCFGSGLFGSGGGFDGDSDLLVWDTPPIVTLDDLMMSNSSAHNFQAMGVPPLPKNRKAACGQYKEEILRQLRELAKSEPNFLDNIGDVKPLVGLQLVLSDQDLQPESIFTGFQHGTEPAMTPCCEANAIQWCGKKVEPSTLLGSYNEENCLVPNRDSDIGLASLPSGGHEGHLHHRVGTESLEVLPTVAVRELTGQERDSAISRYKEKKKTRRYDKHIRYESRKIRAESRTRFRGRFAKMGH